MDIVKRDIDFVYIPATRSTKDIEWGENSIFERLITKCLEDHTRNRDKWLEKYKYTGETFSRASKIFDVAYKFISASPKTIFMAMEYKSEQVVADYNGALSRAVHTLNNMGGNILVEAYPIMTGKGKSFSITADIYNKIEECAIFIADTTEANPNVMYELGIAYNKKKPIIMVREKGKHIKVPSDIISDYYYAFSGMTELENLFVTHIKEILVSDYGAVFSD